ncbi:permease-like cell division protein FtsX [bacterium]|nr:permease-like cell division protein FtsX [bacterium]
MKKNLNNNSSTATTSTIISLSLVLFVIGLLAVILINSSKVANTMKESIVFSIMIKDSSNMDSTSTINQENEFFNYLTHSKYFKDVRYINKGTAFNELKKDLGEEFVSILESNPLLNSYEAFVNAKFVSAEGLKEIENFIQNYNGEKIVQDVFYQKNLVENLNKNVKNISVFLLIFCGIFFLISFTLINNTIRLAIYSKRLLIRTMRLVGATNFFIQKPYLIGSIYQGFYSSVLAIFMIIGSIEILKKQIPDVIQTNDVIDIAIIFGLMLLTGIFTSWISTYFAVRRYLNLNENELYN